MISQQTILGGAISAIDFPVYPEQALEMVADIGSISTLDKEILRFGGVKRPSVLCRGYIGGLKLKVYLTELREPFQVVVVQVTQTVGGSVGPSNEAFTKVSVPQLNAPF